MTTTTVKLTTADVAITLGTDRRTLRRFLRDSAFSKQGKVGQGSRYEFSRSEVTAMKPRFQKWIKAQEAAKAERDANAVKRAKKAAAPKSEKAAPKPRTRADRRAAGSDRAAALDDALKSKGSHVSQNA